MEIDQVELWHWKFRDEALTRRIEFVHDTVNMASAYRSPVSREDLEKHQYELDVCRFLKAEAEHKVKEIESGVA